MAQKYYPGKSGAGVKSGRMGPAALCICKSHPGLFPVKSLKIAEKILICTYFAGKDLHMQDFAGFFMRFEQKKCLKSCFPNG